MKTAEEINSWTVYKMPVKEFIEKLGLASDTDFISVYASVARNEVEIKTTRKGQK